MIWNEPAAPDDSRFATLLALPEGSNLGQSVNDAMRTAKLDNVTIEANDVLLNITDASVARCCMVPTAVLPARVSQHVSIIRANEESDPFYILDTINNDERKRQLLALAQGSATREALTKTTINNLEISIPGKRMLHR